MVATGDVPEDCKKHIQYAVNHGKFSESASAWYAGIKEISGVTYGDATFQDFQRFYKCKGLAKGDCNDKGLQLPITCSYPPCNQCSTGNYFRCIKMRLTGLHVNNCYANFK